MLLLLLNRSFKSTFLASAEDWLSLQLGVMDTESHGAAMRPELPSYSSTFAPFCHFMLAHKRH
eukprot:1441822-Amphidinium_carterae.1